MSWINKIFGKEKNTPSRKIEYFQITTDWNADPVSPEIKLSVKENDLFMEIYLNHYAYDNFKGGDKVLITFKNCSEYSLNKCNDEGYYYGQYRITNKELPWGEFYEIKSGLDRNLPNPVIKISNNNSDNKHFVFFLKDETFECLANNFELNFYSEN